MEHIAEFSYWTFNGYTEADVDAAFDGLDNFGHNLNLRFKFRDRSFQLTFGKQCDKVSHIATVIVHYMQSILQFDPDLKGDIVFSLEDSIDALGSDRPLAAAARRAPFLTFGKTTQEHYSFLVPDFDFLLADGYLVDYENLDKVGEIASWDKKKSTAFWRGASTGFKLEADSWQKNPRIKLALLSKKLDNPDFLDAYLSSLVQCPEETKSKITEADLVRPWADFPIFLLYKYLIDIDGNACAWRSFFLKMYSNSVVLKVESPNIEWCYDRIVPWVHYIPVSNNLSDLEEKIHWAHAHDEQCRAISLRATEVMKEIQKEDPVTYGAKLIRRIFECQRW